MDSAEVVVAAYALVGALIGAAVTAAITVWSGHRQRENEMVIAALSHMVGGSQERTAGIAALDVLLGEKGIKPGRFPQLFRRRARYVMAITWEYQAQLIYVLSHGPNRFAAHEITNVIAMGNRLFAEGQPWPHAWMRERLIVAMRSYARQEAVDQISHMEEDGEHNSRTRSSTSRHRNPPLDPDSVIALKLAINKWCVLLGDSVAGPPSAPSVTDADHGVGTTQHPTTDL
ncbi:hypothetical protein [Microbacterium pumilum]|uniref:DUF4760 domain-containing protein n=1 Tax=Microbacterium pumilum TaxID=344165 RepID=A0ABN2T671_9MICO